MSNLPRRRVVDEFRALLAFHPASEEQRNHKLGKVVHLCWKYPLLKALLPKAASALVDAVLEKAGGIYEVKGL